MFYKSSTVIFAALLLCSALFAAGIPSPALAAGEIQSTKNGPWLVRFRAIGIVPDEDSTTSVGGQVEVDEVFVPELDISYFFTDNIALELILTNRQMDTQVNGVPGLGTVPLGDVGVLPPSLLLQYHFLPGQKFQPYVGAGINYSVFHGEDAPGGAVASIDYDDAFGAALQVGMDYMIDDHWVLNFDVKKIFMQTDVTINGALGRITADVDVDPWIFGVGVGYRF